MCRGAYQFFDGSMPSLLKMVYKSLDSFYSYFTNLFCLTVRKLTVNVQRVLWTGAYCSGLR